MRRLSGGGRLDTRRSSRAGGRLGRCGAGGLAGGTGKEGAVKLFEPLLNQVKFPIPEQVALIAVLLVAVAGLVYAGMLVKQVREADQGTPRMQEIAEAVREGANAYLGAQFRKIGPLIVVITVALFFTKYSPASRRTCRSPSAGPAPSCSARCLAGRSASSA